MFTVGGKMFALVDLGDEHGRVTVKSEPGYAAALMRQAVQPRDLDDVLSRLPAPTVTPG